jgi:hypothetical protein
MKTVAVYVDDPDDQLAGVKSVHVRVHYKFDQLGGLKGTSFHTVEREEVKPVIIFMRDEVPNPIRNAVVSVDLGEAYRIDHTNPPDDITITTHIIALSHKDANMLPLNAVLIADPLAPDTNSRIFIRVDYCRSPNHLIFDFANPPLFQVGSVVSIRDGVAFRVDSIVSANTAKATQIDVSGLPCP